MPILRYTDDAGVERTRRLHDGEHLIGRVASNDVHLADHSVSRQHARLEVSGDEVWLEDLLSQNGTIVNGRRQVRARIGPDDVVQIGPFTLRVELGAQDGRAELAGAEESTDVTVLTELDMQQSTLRRALRGAAEAGASVHAAVEEARKLGGDAAPPHLVRNLVCLLHAAERLHVAETRAGSLQAILDAALEATGGTRGCVFVTVQAKARGGGVPATVLPASPEVTALAHGAPPGPMVVSSTIVNRVFEEGRAFVMQTHERLSGAFSRSLTGQGVHAALCVPMALGDEVIGIIYIDRTGSPAPFTRDDLEIVTALGYLGAGAIQRFTLEGRLRRELVARAALARFHSPSVVETILARPDGAESDAPDDPLSPREVEATVVFCDLAGFTQAAEALGPLETWRVLNEYLCAMAAVVFRHGGTLDKFIGDAVMAIFGAPFGRPDDAVRAVRAGLEMIEACSEVVGRERAVPGLSARVGINTGRMVAGTLGPATRHEYTVLGDAVNVAARLEASARPGEVVIGERTYGFVAPHFLCEPVGETRVKGRQALVRRYRVRGVRG